MKYSRRLVVLHWLTFGLLLILAGTGLAYSYDLAGKGAIIAHQFAGQVLVLLILARLVERLRAPKPLPRAEGPDWETRLAGVVHILMYVVLIAFAVTGYVSASALGEPSLIAPVDRAFARSDVGEIFLIVHFALKWVLLALFALHVAGAVKHHLIDKDDTLSNMQLARK